MISGKTNENRLKRMVHRNDCVEKLRAEAKSQLLSEFTSDSVTYQNTLGNLIIQVRFAIDLLFVARDILISFHICVGHD